jgi:hypothetical protein
MLVLNQNYYVVDDKLKDYVKGSAHKKWKDFKDDLKERVYIGERTDEELDDTKQVCQVGTLSAECCSKSKFSPRGNSGFISNSRGIVAKALVVLLREICKTNS